jgi:hypothetical protein
MPRPLRPGKARVGHIQRPEPGWCACSVRCGGVIRRPGNRALRPVNLREAKCGDVDTPPHALDQC